MSTPDSLTASAPAARSEQGYLQSSDGTRLFWRSVLPEKTPLADVIVVHGYADHSGRFEEALGRLAARGFAAHALDYRGHGQSDGRRGFVERFADYHADLSAFQDHVGRRGAGRKQFVLAHSLGALIAADWLQGGTRAVAGVVLSSPFLGLALQAPRWKVALARLVDRFVPWLPIDNELKVDQLTSDPDIQRATERDPLYFHNTTPRWFFEAMRAQQQVLARAGELTLPTLVLVGLRDPIASPAVTHRFFEALGSKDKTLKTYEAMLHEVLNERGRDRVYSDVLDWLAAHV